MKENKINNPVIIIGIALLLLLINSYTPEGIVVLGYEFKQVDFLSDIRSDNYYDSDEEYDDQDEYEDEVDNDSTLLNGNPQYNLASIINLSFLSEFIFEEFNKFENAGRIASPIDGNINQLNKFFSALKKADKQQVRIAHYGDSALEGDLISSDLRDLFQKKFGGKGVGIVPITSQDVKFRKTTDLSFSDDWTTASLFARNKERLPLGIGGQVFLNADGSWVKMKTNKRYKTVKSFDIAKLIYSDAKRNAKVEYSVNNGKAVSKSLVSGKKLNILEIENNGSTEIMFTFPGDRSANYFGVSLESNNGVYIDNFALRGNTGVDLKKLSAENIKAFDDEFNYKLVILEFGLNILSANKTNYSRYEKNMIKVINKMKSSMPNASFLLIGTHDKCIKKGSKFLTDPAVPKLVDAQKNIAKKTGIAFWNLFEAMGGENSMVKWVGSNPPRAFRDYVHFNDVGAKEEAEMLFNELMKKYK